MTLSAAGNLVALGVCGANPATASDLPAGTYTIRLEASTLSKGTVDTEPRLPSMDNYVVVHLPFSQSTSTEERFLMLNGVGAQYSFTLDQPGSVEAFFVDSDSEANHGTATLSVTPGDRVITVDAAANVIGWRALCQAEPARLWVDAGQHELTLESSSLSSAAGREDDYVLVRLPSEFPEDDYRYVILNGVGSKFVVDAAESEWVRAWFISSNTDASGEATLRVGRQQLAQ